LRGAKKIPSFRSEQAWQSQARRFGSGFALDTTGLGFEVIGVRLHYGYIIEKAMGSGLVVVKIIILDFDYQSLHYDKA